MATRRVRVTAQMRDEREVAERFTVAALAWARLTAAGVAGQIAERLRLARKDGCSGVLLVAMLLFMWLAGLRGQRALQREAKGCKRALAAAIGATKWHTQSAMSRALRSASQDQVRSFGDWLLREALPVGALERDACTAHRDTFGELWRLTDVDGRVLAIRQRGLPEGDDLPDPDRLAPAIARPGYPGRKRGEVMVHRMVMQDSGSSRWLGVRVSPGGGEHAEEMRWAAQTSAAWADQLGTPRSRVCQRFDGKAAGMPAIRACIAAGISCLTRWTDYAALLSTESTALLNDGAWRPVLDSGSGPRREALEFGVRMEEVPASDASTQPAPVPVRIVVSRYPLDGSDKRGCGKVIDGYVYEMYATLLPGEAWPAAELCELYYNRTKEENDFERFDELVEFGHVVSWHLPGLELATSVALFSWNLRLQWGAELSGWAPAPLLPQPPREIATSAGPTATDSSESAQPAPTSAVAPEAEAHPDAGIVDEELQLPPTARADTAPDVPGQHDHFADLPVSDTPPEAAERSNGPVPAQDEAEQATTTRQGLARLAVLAALHATEPHTRLRGWRWDEDAGQLRCPADKPARIHALHALNGGDAVILFRMRGKKACSVCPRRSGCTSSTKPDFRKELRLPLRRAAGESLPARPKPAVPVSLTQRHRAPPPYQRGLGPPPLGGPYTAMAPALVASVLRNMVADALAGSRVVVESSIPAPVPRLPAWLSPSAARRQHRRRTWTARLARSWHNPEPLELRLHMPVGTLRRQREAVARSIARDWDRVGIG